MTVAGRRMERMAVARGEDVVVLKGAWIGGCALLVKDSTRSGNGF